MLDRPSGTVTFLFTDIEGSTQRWEKFPDAMARAFKRQEEILRDAFTRHNGFAYKMIGEAFQVAFATAPDALDAAIDAQRELHVEDWSEIGEIDEATFNAAWENGSNMTMEQAIEYAMTNDKIH